MACKLVFLRGSKIGSSITLNAGNEYVVGRDTSCEIKVTEGDVSARHVQLRLDGTGELWLENLTRHEGATLVNDAPVGLKATVRFSPMDEVAIGTSHSVLFRVEASAAEDAPSGIGGVSVSQETCAFEDGAGSQSRIDGEATHYSELSQRQEAGAAASESSASASPGPPHRFESPQDASVAGERPSVVEDDKSSVPESREGGACAARPAAPRNFERRRAPRWLFFASLLFSASIAMFSLIVSRLSAGSDCGDATWRKDCVDFEKAVFEKAVANAVKCLDGDGEQEWRKGAVWLVRAASRAGSGERERVRDLARARRARLLFLMKESALSDDDEPLHAEVRRSVAATIAALARGKDP